MSKKYTIVALLIAAASSSALIASPAYAGQDRFVVVTDSHGVGRFGEVLVQWLRERPNTRFDFMASGASAPKQWLNGLFVTPCGFSDDSDIATPKPRACQKLRTEKLSALWDRHASWPTEPRRISVIALGTNTSLDPTQRKQQVDEARRLAEVAQTRADRCFWVGPPRMKRHPGFDADGVEYKYQIIQEALAQTTCTLVDSRAFSHYPIHGGDGIHYHWPGWTDPATLEAAETWANGVSDQIERLLSAD